MPNKIAFTGFKNVTIFNSEIDLPENEPEKKYRRLCFQATDDDEKDLSFFQKYSKLSGFPMEDGFIRIDAPLNEPSADKLYINGKLVHNKDFKDLKVLDRLSNITQKIATGKESRKLDINYLNSNKFIENISINFPEQLRLGIDKNFIDFDIVKSVLTNDIKKCFIDKENIMAIAEDFSERINNKIQILLKNLKHLN